MTALRPGDLRQYSDVLHLRSGQRLTLRFVEPGDADALQAYVRGLSQSSRYRRFLGAASELPPSLLDGFTHAGEDDRFSVIAIASIEGVERIVAEARYALSADQASVEFGLSVDDQWQGHGMLPVGVSLARLRPPKRLVGLPGDVAPGQADIVQITLAPAGKLMTGPVTLPPKVDRLGQLGEHPGVMMICHRFMGESGHFGLLKLIQKANIASFGARDKRHLIPLQMT